MTQGCIGAISTIRLMIAIHQGLSTQGTMQMTHVEGIEGPSNSSGCLNAFRKLLFGVL
jgi:hypothetical protein